MRLDTRLRRLLPGVLAIVVGAGLYVGANSAVAVSGASQTAAHYKFRELPITLPPGYNDQHMNTIREVNPAFQKIRSWISAVGASIAINDITGHGRADGMCIVDPRTNGIIVTYTPTAPVADRFTPFTLNPAPLPYDNTMAPTGCAAGDFTGDGRIGFLVTYWGRTPILFLPKADARAPSASAYLPQELLPSDSADGRYHGPRWNTDAAYVADLDGSGHPSIMIGNYFPESDVLDPNGLKNVSMTNSLSTGNNAGGDRVLHWRSATSGTRPSVHYVEEREALPFQVSSGWTLAISGADLTGDGLPEVYIANDFGHGHLLFNRSTRGSIRFTEAKGERTPTTPKSFVVGNGSFKGMGVDFADLNSRGRFDFLVSNINVAWGLEESNLVFVNQAKDEADMARQLDKGVAPFTQKAQQYGLAWTGWCWDVKTGDFLNNGQQEVIQTDGFIKGDDQPVELAAGGGHRERRPAGQPGDVAQLPTRRRHVGRRITGLLRQELRRHLRQHQLRAGPRGPDPDPGHRDRRHHRHRHPGLRRRPAVGTAGLLHQRVAGPRQRPRTPALPPGHRPGRAGKGLQALGTPAYGATVRISTPQGSQISQVDGGGGHVGIPQLRRPLRDRFLHRPGHPFRSSGVTSKAACTSRPCRSSPASTPSCSPAPPRRLLDR